MTVPRLMVILVFAAALVDAKLNNGRMVNMFWDQALQFGYPQATRNRAWLRMCVDGAILA